MRNSIFLFLGLTSLLWAENPEGLVGGRDGFPFAAQVFADGAVRAGFPFASDGIINSVAINSSGLGLIGGVVFPYAGYAGFITPDGKLTPLTGISTQTISSVSLNSSGQGLIGGGYLQFGGGPQVGAYAAFVNSNGSVTPLSGGSLPSFGLIESVAINTYGAGLIGGTNIALNQAYAALVSPQGTVTELSGITSFSTEIFSVAINSSGAGLFGGSLLGTAPYGGFVYPTGLVSPFALPLVDGVINSVALNDAGTGIIGGQVESNSYAAFMSPNGALTPLSGLPRGQILSVAINQSGTALIGGEGLGGVSPFAALVSSNGAITVLSNGLSSEISIDSVAINDAGVGLIGGSISNTSGYAALVAPNGTLTPLSYLPMPDITSVAIALLNLTTGPYFSVMNGQLAASQALETHLNQQHQLCSPEILACDSASAFCKEGVRVWSAPFGGYLHQSAQDDCPSYTNRTAGLLVAAEGMLSSLLVGGGIEYGYNYFHVSNQSGHGHIQQETAFVYVSLDRSIGWISGALWGGVFELQNERHTLSTITSTASPIGGLLSPHLEGALTVKTNRTFLTWEPFFILDWVNVWQRAYTEKGKAGLNLIFPSIYTCFLRSEAGVRWYETFCYSWGRLLLEEKLSYVNRAPFGFSSVTTSFIASPSSFPIAIGGNSTENLGAFQFRSSLIPTKPIYPYGALDFQLELGPHFQSYSFLFELGRVF